MKIETFAHSAPHDPLCLLPDSQSAVEAQGGGEVGNGSPEPKRLSTESPEDSVSHALSTSSDYLIRELQPDDLDYIAANLRAADARELRAASGHSNYRDRLTMAVADSSEVRIVEHDGRPILVFGFAPLDETTAGVWAVGTSTVSRFRAPLVRKRSADGVRLEVPWHKRLDIRYRPALSDAGQGLG